MAGTAPIWGTGLIVVGSAVIVWDMYNDNVSALDQIDKTKDKLRNEVDPYSQHENDQLKELDQLNNPDPADDEEEDSALCK
jgi:hypothetical protein